MNDADTYLSAAQVRSRYGDISDMSLWRWSNNPAMGFPKPLRINRRRFFRLRELEEWERSRAAHLPGAA